PSYFSLQNSDGILYDIDLKNDSLTLKSTLGEKTLVESRLLQGHARFDKTLLIDRKSLLYDGKTIYSGNDHKMKPFIYNDTCIVLMSDRSQAVGFYKLMVYRIPK